MHLEFAPAEAAQVDFGSRPVLVDARTGAEFKIWFFLMALCWSRHQYTELVFKKGGHLADLPSPRLRMARGCGQAGYLIMPSVRLPGPVPGIHRKSGAWNQG